MATTLLFSHHSSNPLELSSSDPRGAAYVRRYQTSLAQNEVLSSDDPIEGYIVPDDLQQYHEHLSQIIPDHNHVAPHQKTPTHPQYVDLDEDMSDDELATPLPKQDIEVLPHRQTGAEESHEEGHSDKDEANEYGDEEGDEDDCMSVDSLETDDENTINERSPEERKEIQAEIRNLMESVPQLQDDYKIVDRLGTGTFSSVYKAVDLHYHRKWDNTPWHGHHPPESSAHYQSTPRPPGSKVFVAIKRIYVTSSPERIKNEVSIMIDCLSCRHVSQLITATRHFDQVVLVMPYQRNEDFREYYRTLSLPAIKSYLRCLMAALRDIHERKIIHRDVKPANFLFDPRTGIGTLCDFGLASRMSFNSTTGTCLHTGANSRSLHGVLRQYSETDREKVKRAQKDARLRCLGPADKVGYPDKDTRPISKANRAGTRGFRAPEVLLKCSDQTGAIDVWAAGTILLSFLTGKFPLFQSNDDVEALMEIATIIGHKQMEKAATLHNRVFVSNVPSITPNGILWRDFVIKQNPDVFKPKEPDFQCYPYNTQAYREYLREEAERLPPPSSSPVTNFFPQPPKTDTETVTTTTTTTTPSSTSSSTTQLHSLFSPEKHTEDVESAFHLLEQLLEPESTRRITPKHALAHPFLAGTQGDDDVLPDDDEFVPHEFGKGVCGKLHFRDDVTDEPCVRIKVKCQCGECDEMEREEVRVLKPGEGIAIGRQPCEFHQNAEF